ncbi:hypothetical protein JIN77_15230 [Verrucomicrobiaceae bacterium R5-34]|uniref:HTH HARE-type domain-containing protein n=1 Tax=Oceaniferula flava TaxID=2800421 RepID=A0AAE2V7P8_9BACT|nr:hypothetical protein [Oceaniferula flavus]MBK1832088.1 hypothetical protein [Verrucomicrobiaceae bacterium R5-34]MBK1854172.1 hypothetical protein [Oceaniferula flavus]MBM1135478.1 hypothetical protein [Oceaniferula flavus]
MSLRTQLNDTLTEYLPANPKEAIKGTELIRLIRMKLDGNYSDASLRYHFSIMSCDPTSPIAKVEKGQGYYRRTAPIPALSSAQEIYSQYQGRLDDIQGDQAQVDHAMMRIRKFRAIVNKWCDVNGRFPFPFREPFAADAPIGNLWKFPEMLLVDWESREGDEQAMPLRKLKTQLGLPPFRLHAARLRILPAHHSFREDFFQTLSASVWAQGGELIYAAPIEDEALADSIRRLSIAFGIGVTTFGLTAEILDDLPRPANILNAHPRETEALMERLDVTRVSAVKSRSHIDWSSLEALRGDSTEVDDLLAWLSESADVGSMSPYGGGE